ncbi:MAG TPA: aldo/keto reductase [Bryobacteraceae bacterium]|nr:aldo/keto reductase [Bryobacteraceae bacterium]
MNRINRRGFLGTGLVAAGAVAAPVSGKRPLPFNPRTHQAMPMNNLGRTGYRVGILSLGGQATLEIPGKEDASQAIINRALDLGINYIDSAAGYGNGTSEKHIGMVLKSRRKETFITSKTADRTYDGSMRLLEKTLANMQTDHLNLWQIHNLQTNKELEQIFASDGAIRAIAKARDEGVASFVGVTGHFEPNVLAEAIRRFPFDTILMAINAADRHYLSFLEHLLPLAQQKKMGTISMKVATRGRVLSTWVPPPPEQQPERMRTRLPGTLTIQEALSYNLSLPVSTTIIGVDTVAQLEQNVAFASSFTPLCAAEMRELEKRTLPIARQALYFRRWDLGA